MRNPILSATVLSVEGNNDIVIVCVASENCPFDWMFEKDSQSNVTKKAGHSTGAKYFFASGHPTS